MRKRLILPLFAIASGIWAFTFCHNSAARSKHPVPTITFIGADQHSLRYVLKNETDMPFDYRTFLFIPLASTEILTDGDWAQAARSSTILRFCGSSFGSRTLQPGQAVSYSSWNPGTGLPTRIVASVRPTQKRSIATDWGIYWINRALPTSIASKDLPQLPWGQVESDPFQVQANKSRQTDRATPDR